MKFEETAIPGVVVIDLNPIDDERGFFARSYSREAFASRGLLVDSVEMNISYNAKAATLRGLHYQAEPYPDPKLVRCTRGSIFDVAVDIRPDSPTFCRWFGTSLSADRRNALHIPAGCAHGFITLEDDTEVFYVMGEQYHAKLARGIRWDDPAIGIRWPIDPVVVSARDAAHPGVAG